MKQDLGKTLKDDKIQSIRLKAPLIFLPDATLENVLEMMGRERSGCAVVVVGGKVVGIFTERDVLTRVIEPGIDLRTPIEKVMTPRPKTLSRNHSIADAIRLMNSGSYRHIPILEEGGKIEGVLSVKGLIRYLAEHFPHEVYNLPPDPHQVQRAREGA